MMQITFKTLGGGLFDKYDFEKAGEWVNSLFEVADPLDIDQMTLQTEVNGLEVSIEIWEEAVVAYQDGEAIPQLVTVPDPEDN